MSENSKKSVLVEGSYSHELEIPSTWEFAKLNEVIEIVGGSQPPKSDFMEEPEGDCVRLIQIRDYKSDNNIVYIPRNKAKRFVTKDEVMIGRYGPPIFQILRGLEGAYNVALMKAKPRDGLFSNEYLYYYLSNKNIYNYVESASDRTAGQSGVNKKHLEQYPVGVPPLAEQKRIVEKLDEVLAQVDTIKARLDGIPALLKRFRQSVLASAVSGKLTEEWRGESDYAFHEEIKAKFPSSWKIETIDNIGSVKGGKRLPKGEELVSTDTGYPYIRAGQLKKGTVIQGTDARNIQMYLEPHVQSQISRYIVSEGDAYITIVGASIGDAGIIPASHNGANLTENAAKICEFQDDVLGAFLGLWLRSELIQRLIKLEIKSGAQGKLALMRIKILPFPRAAIEEQKEIVRLVDQYFAFADTIEAQVKKAQARVDNLTQSILAKAFRGELVPQDPNDEPADKLLERITQARKEAEALAKAAKKAEAAKKRAAKSA
ncbi:restriction endonuclease subunit S [Vibrio vulnificus]|uniref:restriction endonuclease subunit S n=1 Tax=Vibrio vulnificus TaxID=672 RepID=UPI001A19D9FD|nr:restriction endonuclease subunit S [Vibrio vulnificus]MCA0769617.1 restriction endonuclease subunit S [Vibrio vulnificus]HAS6241273.1 restriction endonuclease subunit S [Vibrio vulnificus]HDY7943397.1 restriction endonuclease subunit S [Vibrio vulnificus]